MPDTGFPFWGERSVSTTPGNDSSCRNPFSDKDDDDQPDVFAPRLLDLSEEEDEDEVLFPSDCEPFGDDNGVESMFGDEGRSSSRVSDDDFWGTGREIGVNGDGAQYGAYRNDGNTSDSAGSPNHSTNVETPEGTDIFEGTEGGEDKDDTAETGHIGGGASYIRGEPAIKIPKMPPPDVNVLRAAMAEQWRPGLQSLDDVLQYTRLIHVEQNWPGEDPGIRDFEGDPFTAPAQNATADIINPAFSAAAELQTLDAAGPVSGTPSQTANKRGHLNNSNNLVVPEKTVDQQLANLQHNQTKRLGQLDAGGSAEGDDPRLPDHSSGRRSIPKNKKGKGKGKQPAAHEEAEVAAEPSPAAGSRHDQPPGPVAVTAHPTSSKHVSTQPGPSKSKRAALTRVLPQKRGPPSEESEGEQDEEDDHKRTRYSIRGAKRTGVTEQQEQTHAGPPATPRRHVNTSSVDSIKTSRTAPPRVRQTIDCIEIPSPGRRRQISSEMNNTAPAGSLSAPPSLKKLPSRLAQSSLLPDLRASAALTDAAAPAEPIATAKLGHSSERAAPTAPSARSTNAARPSDPPALLIESASKETASGTEPASSTEPPPLTGHTGPTAFSETARPTEPAPLTAPAPPPEPTVSTDAAAPIKRKRGRPPKHPLPTPPALVAPLNEPPPPTVPTGPTAASETARPTEPAAPLAAPVLPPVPTDAGAPIKRKRGRPPKQPLPAPPASAAHLNGMVALKIAESSTTVAPTQSVTPTAPTSWTTPTASMDPPGPLRSEQVARRLGPKWVTHNDPPEPIPQDSDTEDVDELHDTQEVTVKQEPDETGSDEPPTQQDIPIKRGPGRPKGSKNRPKPPADGSTTTTVKSIGSDGPQTQQEGPAKRLKPAAAESTTMADKGTGSNEPQTHQEAPAKRPKPPADPKPAAAESTTTTDESTGSDEPQTQQEIPAKRLPGRPKGSKNRPKPPPDESTTTTDRRKSDRILTLALKSVAAVPDLLHPPPPDGRRRSQRGVGTPTPLIKRAPGRPRKADQSPQLGSTAAPADPSVSRTPTLSPHRPSTRVTRSMSNVAAGPSIPGETKSQSTNPDTTSSASSYAELAAMYPAWYDMESKSEEFQRRVNRRVAEQHDSSDSNEDDEGSESGHSADRYHNDDDDDDLYL
ncbi:hypothetical protein CC85DRAFT_22421 [Cutaneotrichosporon oleaginosum]|uniref:Uncharacterized protein n=1 Tax=Cutaneotrichosporon oleaginosum TaxID=879819 RepID=A0A0J0XC19_9TREE|nr:uncharacterized protein CC85DRAFT_22421 [Cutaneotrichosporon oleaginosum]KLT38597.1 hypothetical protein CC85DRAFT_22421 [Cutaneotrichosporon oleaginosum]